MIAIFSSFPAYCCYCGLILSKIVRFGYIKITILWPFNNLLSMQKHPFLIYNPYSLFFIFYIVLGFLIQKAPLIDFYLILESWHTYTIPLLFIFDMSTLGLVVEFIFSQMFHSHQWIIVYHVYSGFWLLIFDMSTLGFVGWNVL